MTPDVETALSWLPELPRDARMTPADPARDALALEFQAAQRAYPRVFEAILAMSLFRSPVDYRLPADQAERYAYQREGQNQLAAGILDYLNHARTLEGGPNERRRRTDQREPRTDGADAWDGRDTDPFLAVR